MFCCIQNIAEDQFSLFVALMVIPWAQSQWQSCQKNESRDVGILTMVIANRPPQKIPAWIACLVEKHFLSHGPHCDRWLQTSQERTLGTVSGLKPSAIKSRKALEQSWYLMSIIISCFVKLGVLVNIHVEIVKPHRRQKKLWPVISSAFVSNLMAPPSP